MEDGCIRTIAMAISFIISFFYVGPQEISDRLLDFFLIGLLIYSVLGYLSPLLFPEYFSGKKNESSKQTTGSTRPNISVPANQPIPTPTYYAEPKNKQAHLEYPTRTKRETMREVCRKHEMEHKVFEMANGEIRNTELFNVDQNVIALGYYYPERYSFHDNYSRMILELKNKNEAAIDYFKELIILEDLNKIKRMTICIIPSSSNEKSETGMSMLAERVLWGYGGTDGKSCLFRRVSIASAHLGGTRSKALHKRTIGVRDTHLIRNKEVVLLDDVYTTGVSMEACRELLLEIGAMSVTGLVLGRTKRSR